MANTRRIVRDGQEDNVDAMMVDNTGANGRENAGGVDDAARGARDNEVPPPPHHRMFLPWMRQWPT